MNTYYQEKLSSLVKRTEVDKSERIFLQQLIEYGTPQTVKATCLFAMQVEDKQDYFLSLIYCFKIKEYLESLGYLDQKSIKELLKIATKLSGFQAKQLFNEVIVGKKASSFNPKEMLDSLNNIVSVVQSTFSNHIKNKSEESDEMKIRQLREKFQNF